MNQCVLKCVYHNSIITENNKGSTDVVQDVKFFLRDSRSLPEMMNMLRILYGLIILILFMFIILNHISDEIVLVIER